MKQVQDDLFEQGASDMVKAKNVLHHEVSWMYIVELILITCAGALKRQGEI